MLVCTIDQPHCTKLSLLQKISKNKSNIILVSEGIHPNDIEVIETLSKETFIEIIKIPILPSTGTTDITALKNLIEEKKPYGVVFSQVNCFGNIEEFDLITDISRENNLKTVANIDPILIQKGGLKRPCSFGRNEEGVDIIIGEGQHLALEPNFGGPGIGIFGIRYNEKDKLSLRSTPGRFIGKTVDANGMECLSIILSTREQHIRREKATSNICSNQSFIATIVGASLLSEGDSGLERKCKLSYENKAYFLSKISSIKGLKPCLPKYTKL